MRLQNKKAIITGANRSIGRAIALEFAKQGADVAISYRSHEKGAQDTIAAVQKLHRSGIALHADFLEVDEIESFFNKALEFLGSVDILVNNAARYNTTPFLDLRIPIFEELLKVGVCAPLFLIQLAAKHMIGQKISGSIINISSISGSRPYPSRTAHSTAKAALNMLTQSASLELAPFGIRVNAIAPGDTPYEEVKQPISVEHIPLQRVGKAQDHANTAVFLASEESSWMTGQIVTIDGGQSLSY
jgi:NAD(P)-dependent dehydrogenase (short-subunit alcohol dehydrogenase family)